MAEEKKQEMLDPIAYREDFPKEYLEDYDPMADLTPEYLENMDYGKAIGGGNQSFSQYGDDSSPEYQQKAKGGLNDKYTGEGVKNDQLNYDENLMLKDLNPNFVYGLASKVYGTDHPGYITQRNDQIASALYNEGKTSKDDVAYFLGQQKGWMNSSEADRANTIEAVYKRLGAIAEQNPKEEEKPDESKADEIVKDNSGEIYGKTSAEEGNPKEGIQTKSDANSVFTAMEETRASNLKNLISMPPVDIASALDKGLLPGDLQSIRDMQQYYPEMWKEVEQYQKKSRTQNEVDSITKGEQSDTSNAGQSVINNANADFANKNAGSVKSSQEITADVNNALAGNQTVQEAKETMSTLEEDMATLKNRLRNLRNEANAAFKGDVPDYLVNAYVANKTQEIQNQMKILEDRYNMAYKRYRDEVADIHWEKEYQIKQDQLQIQKDELALKDYQIKNGITTTGNTGTSTTNPGDKFQVTTLSDKEVADAVDNLYNMFDNGQLGNAQCGVGIQRYYLPMLGISISGISSLEGKKSLINEDSGYTPKKGDLIIINSGAKLSDGTPAGHVGIVLEVHSDGTVEYMDWNGKSDEKPAINGININSKSILGYRNINKGQGQNSGGWTDYDYTRFEQYRDATSKSEKETIAAEYGTNVQGMNNIVRDALTNRPESEQESGGDYSNEFGYDPEKGYNIYDTQLYQRFFAGGTNNSADKLAEAEGVPVDVFTNRARRWKAANKGAVDSMISEGLDDSQKSILSQIVSGDIKLSNSNEKAYADALGLGGDVELLNQVIGEAYQLEGKKQLSEALRVAAELQIMFEDAKKVKDNGDFNTKFYMGDHNLSEIGRKFDQLKNALKLDKVVNARGRGTTFGSMTEGEWDMLGKSVTSLSIALDKDSTFTKGFKRVVTDLWAAQYGEPGGEIVGPTTEEWDAYVKSVRKSSDFSISSANGGSNESIDMNTALSGLNSWKQGNTGGGSGDYVNQYSILQ